ncbi:MAG: hypothetical protein JWO37_1348 [Acidimicrobiales bacterium]|nr:hypothetical protein [Acidimicrobiales bacterium]
MLDHVFMDAIGALRDAFESALLERQAFEERFQVDVLLGDVTWETAYSLPGEGQPPRVLAEISLDWPTWSQTSYRSWYIGELFGEPPEIEVEIVLRIQRLTKTPDPAAVLRALPTESPTLGDESLTRSPPVVEQLYDEDLTPSGAAVEVSYEGVYQLAEEVLSDGSIIDTHFASMGGWIASTLVRLGDLKLEYLPPD